MLSQRADRNQKAVRSGRFKPGFFLLVNVVCAPATAGDGQWTKQRFISYVLNNKQDALAFADSWVGWYGNGTGQVYRTTDLGEHLQAVWNRRGTYVRALEFVDEKTGFLGNVGPDYFPNVTDRQPLDLTKDGAITGRR
jgi:hypothetical protein